MIVETYGGILNNVLSDRFFGLIECDIETPELLKSYLAGMPPIFKNVEITYNDLSEETKQQVKSNYKSRKLIGSYFGSKMLFHTDLLKWYLQKGLVVTNITYAVRYEPKSPFIWQVYHKFPLNTRKSRL